MLTLYDYPRSSSCFRVRIALNLKKLAYDRILIHLVKDGGQQHTKTYQNINPQQRVPTLVDGSRIITQSLAIIDYLEQLYPAPPLFNQNPYQRALIQAFVLTITADIQPLNNLSVLNYLTKDLSVTDEQKSKWYQHWIAKGFFALEKQLEHDNHDMPFCFGQEPGIADIFLVPQMYNARRFACDLSPYPTLVRIDQTCQRLPAFQEAWPIEELT